MALHITAWINDKLDGQDWDWAAPENPDALDAWLTAQGYTQRLDADPPDIAILEHTDGSWLVVVDANGPCVLHGAPTEELYLNYDGNPPHGYFVRAKEEP